MKVGDTAYFVSKRGEGRLNREVTVTKVGRKWHHLSNGMVAEIQSGRTYENPKGDYYTGELHPSKAAFVAQVDRNKAWQKLRDYFWASSPHILPHLTTAQLQQILAQLKGEAPMPPAVVPPTFAEHQHEWVPSSKIGYETCVSCHQYRPAVVPPEVEAQAHSLPGQ